MEKITGYTPGPWEVNGITIVSEKGDVCLLGWPAQYPGDMSEMLNNHEANAALIVMAPTLYEENTALKAEVKELVSILETLVWRLNELVNNVGPGDDEYEAIQMALAILSKHKGS